MAAEDQYSITDFAKNIAETYLKGTEEYGNFLVENPNLTDLQKIQANVGIMGQVIQGLYNDIQDNILYYQIVLFKG